MIEQQAFDLIEYYTEWLPCGCNGGFCTRCLGKQGWFALRLRRLTPAAPDAAFRCSYCGSPLSDDDTARDGEALWCADCGMRVEYWDALSEAEESRA